MQIISRRIYSHLIRLRFLSFVIALAVGGLLPATSVAQTSGSEEDENPVERIMRESEGNVEIDIPESILQQILTPPEAPKKKQERTENLRKGINKLQGYRVQVFSDGRNQQTLEARAKARGNAVLAKFPKYRGQVYSFSKSPSWYTRVGNFRTEKEAANALAELKRAFPKFAGEMRVVKCQIVVVK